MEDIRDKQLDKLASGVADERHAQAESREAEAGLLQAVSKRMRALKIMTFKAHGVQFTRVPGDEKLQVRLSKAGGDDAVPQEPEGDIVQDDYADLEAGDDEPGNSDDGDVEDEDRDATADL